MFYYVAHRDILGFCEYSLGPYPTRERAALAMAGAPVIPDKPILYIAECINHNGIGTHNVRKRERPA